MADEVPEGAAVFPTIPAELGVHPLLLAVLHAVVFLEGKRVSYWLLPTQELPESVKPKARPGDTVVITGKGHERSIVVAGRREPWSDADTVQAVLRELV